MIKRMLLVLAVLGMFGASAASASAAPASFQQVGYRGRPALRAAARIGIRYGLSRAMGYRGFGYGYPGYGYRGVGVY